MIGGRHRSNMELIAQGIANIFSGLFGGIPATGAIARTATNIKNGGRTPVAGIAHALTLLFIVLFLGQWAKLIPMACLAGILIVVSYHMSEWRSFVVIFRGPKSGWIVLLTTFLLTVFIDLTVAIEIGMVLSAFLFMHRMAEVTHVQVIAKEMTEQEEKEDRQAVNKIQVPEGVEIYEINGPFFFGMSHKFEEAMRSVEKRPKIRIFRLRHVPFIDSTGLYHLEQFHRRCRKDQIHMIIEGVHSQPLKLLKKSGFYEMVGTENFFPNIYDAIQKAKEITGHPVKIPPPPPSPETSQVS